MIEIQKRKENGDATLFYMDIIKKATIAAGEEVIDGYSFENSRGRDIIALSPSVFRHISKLRPKSVSVWFQGVAGVEYLHYGECSKLKKIERYVVLSLYEWLALRRTSLNFFVSKKMLEYYRKTFGYKKDNYVVMPCFNDQLKEDSFFDDKYKKPTFVYAGNLARWQCFPEMVELYKSIKARVANAELTIYTPDQERAKEILKEKDVEAIVKYVPYTQVAEEIKGFKYGFLIREDDTVNNVATPTKMCNYLANGIIPVFSNGIGDFKEELKDLRFGVPLGTKNEGINKLYELEKCNIKANEVRADFQTIFDRYYSVDYYVQLISDKIKQYISDKK